MNAMNKLAEKEIAWICQNITRRTSMHIVVPGPPLVRPEPICTNSTVPMLPEVE